MKDNFWKELPRPFFVLAPMEEVTDVVFRHVVAEAARPDVFFTEFTNSDSYCHPKGRQSVQGRLTFTEDEQPLVAHIWGDKPEHFREMSIGMAEAGFKGIDLNMGCPVPNVAGDGKGSGLIQRPEVAAELIEAAKAGGLPVSVKTRLGYTEIDEWKTWLKHVLEQDIANLSIHLRTRKEMSKYDAHWELIPEIKQLRDEIASETLLTIKKIHLPLKRSRKFLISSSVSIIDLIMCKLEMFNRTGFIPQQFENYANPGYPPHDYDEIIQIAFLMSCLKILGLRRVKYR